MAKKWPIVTVGTAVSFYYPTKEAKMSDKTILSEHSWIEGEHLHTESFEVAAAWLHHKRLMYDDGIDFYGWRTPITAAREVYRYREGEPWCRVHGGNGRIYVSDRGSPDGAKHMTIVLHVRALIVCDGNAESLRKLHERLEEA